jgi:AraC family transcriptional regulator
MRATGFDTVIGHTPGPQSQAIAQFCVDPKPEARRTAQSPLTDSMAVGRRARLDRLHPFVASSLVELIEIACRELERDQEAAKASLATASRILNAEVECHSSDACLPQRGLAAWQIIRVRDYVDRNLHRAINVQDLSQVARRSPAHFSRRFKLAVGESPHAYVVRRRLDRACHLMITGAASLSDIALSVGLSDQAHLCRLFRQTYGQSPAAWRRARDLEASRPEADSRTYGEVLAIRAAKDEMDRPTDR